MKILFTSDLHGEELAFRQFSKTLSMPEFDLGIIAGDLQDDILIKEEVTSILNITLNELPNKAILQSSMKKQSATESSETDSLHLALEAKAVLLRKVLCKSGKPILIVRGNHDRIDWKTDGCIVNIGQGRYEYSGYSFVGYEFTEQEKTPDEQEADMLLIEKLMHGKTILVSHAPPKGILDTLQVRDSERGKIPVHLGSQALASLKKRKAVSLHLFGHVHQSFGIVGNCVNGSYSPILRKMISIEKKEKGFVLKSIS
jgi:Icc-related predicted phosphoesterase